MRKFQIRLISEEEIKELVAVANNFSELQKLLNANYTLQNYTAISIKTLHR